MQHHVRWSLYQRRSAHKGHFPTEGKVATGLHLHANHANCTHTLHMPKTSAAASLRRDNAAGSLLQGQVRRVAEVTEERRQICRSGGVRGHAAVGGWPGGAPRGGFYTRAGPVTLGCGGGRSVERSSAYTSGWDCASSASASIHSRSSLECSGRAHRDDLQQAASSVQIVCTRRTLIAAGQCRCQDPCRAAGM